MKVFSKEELIKLFKECKENNSGKSLDELLDIAFNQVKEDENDSFDKFKAEFLKANGIDEYQYYTKNVNPELKRYIEENVFPQYSKNDQGHGILHILEVIRRSFALRDTLGLKLDDNIMYASAACHDWGKYEEHETGEKHAKIAGRRFINDKKLTSFFSSQDAITVKEAIEDHSSSLEDMPRSDYGKLVSSADRNTSIRMVFIRSFFVGKRKNPTQTISDYLEYTLQRLRKRYSEEDSENMFYADKTYENFLADMRTLLKDGDKFKNLYCETNHITSYDHVLAEEPGETSYINMFKAKETEER